MPITRFEFVDIDKETEMLTHFMDGSRWLSTFIKAYPELEFISKKITNKEDGLKIYKKFLEKIHEEKKSEIFAAKDTLQFEWDKVGSEFLKILSDHFETEWPEDKPEIVGQISVLPVFPRFLDHYKYFVGYKNFENLIEICAHETLHFLWFKKWKEVFPEIQRKEYENPHLAWRLSEIMDPIILQCHPKIKELIKPKKWGYKTFEGVKIGDIGMTEYFKNIYLTSLNSGDSFDVTLKKLWKEAKEHEEEISKF